LSDTTAGLKPLFDKSDGFISIACFERLTQRGKVLSLSFFRDEMAVAAWRSLESIGRTKAQVEAVSSRTIVCALRPPYATMGCSSASRNPGFVAGKSIVVAIGQQRTRHRGDSVAIHLQPTSRARWRREPFGIPSNASLSTSKESTLAPIRI
jgi:hypothetical protein